MAGERIRVQVVCAEAERQTLRELELPPGSTVAEAVERSGVLAAHPGVDAARCSYGIFGRRVQARDGLRDGDRVEILRPLPEDPRERRRRRAREGRTMAGGSARRG